MTTPDLLAVDRLAKVFTPNRPIHLPALLSGRLDLLFRLQDDVLTPGKHVLLYGDRGVGKTSIARVLGVLVQEVDDPHGNRSIIVACDSNDTYDSIWRKVFQEVLIAERQLGFEQSVAWNIVGRWTPETPIVSPNDVRILIEGFPNQTTVIIDEFDRVQDDSTRLLMTDTIKLFSDSNTRSTIVLVGVGQSIEELVSAHQSISRNLDYVPVDPMAPVELAAIISKGFESANMRFEDGLEFAIAHLAQGYPHYAHLLGLWTGRKAAGRGSTEVVSNDLDLAIPESIRNAAGSIRVEYDQATDSNQPNNLFKQVLLACALADKDVRGRFSLGAVREPLQDILGRSIDPISYQRHLAAFCEDVRGPALVKTGRRRNYRWHFSDPQMIPFVQLQGIHDGFITKGTQRWVCLKV